MSPWILLAAPLPLRRRVEKEKRRTLTSVFGLFLHPALHALDMLLVVLQGREVVGHADFEC